MRVLAITHGPLVGPELFGDVVVEEGHELVEWDIRLQGAPPKGADAVLVFGGDQNVGEELEHPWLREEYVALRRWVGEGRPLLCVCLGAQTLAHALGAAVEPVGTLLAGFYATELTDAGAADPVLGVLPRRFEALNVNGYRFDVPEGAVALAHGPTPQAFRVDGSAWGVQFHPEVRRDQVLRWFAEEAVLPRPLAELAAELDEKLSAWQEHGRRICRAFLAAAQAAGGV
jgi:GMP synthase-like glutamine amidotransferase